MTNADLIAYIDQEIAKLKAAREILAPSATPTPSALETQSPAKRKYTKRKKAPTA